MTTSNLKPNANDGLGLGNSGTGFSDLYLASGGVIDFNAGDVVFTHSSDTLTLSGSGATKLVVEGDVSGSAASTGSFGRLLLAAPPSANMGATDLQFGDGQSGFKLRNAAQLNVVIAGSAVAQFNGDRLDLGSYGSSKHIWAGAASVSAPAYSFAADTDTGMYLATTGQL